MVSSITNTKMVKLTSPGKFIPLDEDNESTYAYIRDDPTINQCLLVVLNMARGTGRGEASTFNVPSEIDASKAKLIVTNGPEKEGSAFGKEMKLEAWEGRIYLLRISSH